ncbi:response regulator transcription factor [Paenibacillus sp. y28]|uniref:response regulator transcription factor n=1 Tax=Paenibacillus sp. y28 TaxID=3129110 RepID=UPI00301AB9D3
MITILIVDDHAMLRSGLSMLLDARPDMRVIGEAAEGGEALLKAADLRPSVVLMDLSMPQGKDGMTTTAELKKQMPEVAVLVLTMHDDEEYLLQSIRAGASGYILKSAPHDELLTAIRTVSSGQAYLNPSATKRLMSEYTERVRHGENTDLYETLSEREKETLAWTAKGYSNKEIAEQLCISVKTVETHKSNVMEKLNLKSRPELIKYALKKGLLQFE